MDPVTGLNISKNSYRIEEVKDTFSYAYDYLNKMKLLFDKNDLILKTNLISNLLEQKKRKTL